MAGLDVKKRERKESKFLMTFSLGREGRYECHGRRDTRWAAGARGTSVDGARTW